MEFKIGDKIVFGRGKKNKALKDDFNVIVGKVYTVEECCGKPAINTGDAFDKKHLDTFDSIAKITLIVEG
jgi:hypothetical protein